MPMTVQLCSEGGEVVGALADPSGGTFDAAGDFDRVLPQAPELHIPDSGRPYRLLQYGDPYGDTVFNRLQMEDLLADIEQAGLLDLSDRERRGLDRLRVIADRCRDSVHLYVWFIGD